MGKILESIQNTVIAGFVLMGILLLLMMQGGMGFSSTPEDALYIEKKLKELNEELTNKP